MCMYVPCANICHVHICALCIYWWCAHLGCACLGCSFMWRICYIFADYSQLTTKNMLLDNHMHCHLWYQFLTLTTWWHPFKACSPPDSITPLWGTASHWHQLSEQSGIHRPLLRLSLWPHLYHLPASEPPQDDGDWPVSTLRAHLMATLLWWGLCGMAVVVWWDCWWLCLGWSWTPGTSVGGVWRRTGPFF